MDAIKQKLTEKYRQNRLGHFYILRSGALETDRLEFLRTWSLSFIHNIMNKQSDHIPIKHLFSHPDFLFLSTSLDSLSNTTGKASSKQKQQKQRDYRIADIAPLFHFLSLKPFKWRHRFIVLENPHHLPPNLQNKLLKVLEEPPTSTTIFFLAPSSRPLIPTIHGRAIQLYIPSSSKPIPKEEDLFLGAQSSLSWFEREMKKKNSELFPDSLKREVIKLITGKKISHKIIDTFKRHPMALDCLITLTIERERNCRSSFQQLSAFLGILYWLQRSKKFGDNLHTQIYALLQHLQKIENWSGQANSL